MAAGLPIGPWRCLPVLALGLWLAVAAGDGRAWAGDPGVPPINPTGRVLDMAVPLHYRKFYLGDLALRITPGQAVLLPLADLVRTLAPLLRPEATERLKQSGVTADGYADLAQLKQAGFAFAFDPAAVQVTFEPTIAQKAEGNISIDARRQPSDSPNRAEPADFAAYLNLRSGADYVVTSGWDSGGEMKAPRLDLEGAMRWKDLVLEAEGTYEADDASFFGESGAGFKRRGTRLIRDFEDEAIRATAGDIYTLGTSFQSTPDILGLSLERSVSKLQPGRNTRSTGRRTFRLERPSNVDVVVNGLSVRKLRLDPGDYNLSDLPVSAGSNDLVLMIEDDVGYTERLEFSLFSDNALLPEGLSEWSLAAGVLTRFETGQPAYDTDRPFATGYVRRGLSESLTGEAHLQGGAQSAMGGAGVLFGTGLGLFALDAAGSTKDGVLGAAFNGDYSAGTIQDGAGRPHSFRLSAKLRTPDFALPDQDCDPSADWLALSASYGTQLPLNIAASVTAGYGFGQLYGEDDYGADVRLSRPLGREMSLGMNAGYHLREGEPGEISWGLRLQYRPDAQTSIAAAYDAHAERSAVSGSREFGQGVGAWQTSVDVVHEGADGDALGAGASVSAAAHYTGNRANVSVSQDSRLYGLDGDVRDSRTSLRVETAIAVADGHVTVGRPVSNGFAIVTPHAGLANNSIGVGKRSGGYEAETDFLGPALLPSISPFTLNRVEYDVADLPPGYDLGDGVFDLQPRNKSGYALKVGSDYTVTALGTLQDSEGAPLALVTGTATERGGPVRPKGGAAKTVEIFTNREGRFSAQGLSPGEWSIEMATEPATRYVLRVPEQTVGMYRAEALRPAAGAGG